MSEHFQSALEELNFGQRCHELASLGAQLSKRGQTGRLESVLDSLEAPNLPDAFVQKARLLVAKKAGCLGYSRKFLDHPSQSVRFSAVRGGLLRPADAREAFLSEDCGRKLKKLLVKCPQLPCDQEVLEQAERLFGQRDRELLWQVLTRVRDVKLFEKWLVKMEEWMEENDKASKVPGLPQLALRFPETMLKLVEKGSIVFKWYWVMPLLQVCPEKILRLTFLESHSEGSGPLRNKIHFDEALASWGWRHQRACMLELCQSLALANKLSSGGHWHLVRLLGALMKVSSTKKYLTASEKMRTLTEAFARVPEAQRSTELCLSFVRLLPDDLPQHREREVHRLVGAFWQMLTDLPWGVRKEALVGSDKAPALTQVLSCYLKKLPPMLAVEQFFQVLKEHEAAPAAFRFVQSDVCKTPSGEQDGLMGRVFERFLQQEKASAVDVAQMFQTLLTDAKTMDVIQASFDLLVRRLGGHTDLKLLQQVVQRMQVLEAASRSNSTPRPPVSNFPVPVLWVRFARLPPSAPPHVDHLCRLLHSSPSGGEPLGEMLKQYGPSFFWDALGHVIQASVGNTPVKANVASPSLEGLRTLDLAGLAKPLRESGFGGLYSEESEEEKSEYFATLIDMKSRTYGRDDDARKAGYREMMKLARADPEPSRAFEDLLPFLLGRLGKEKENVRVEAIDALFVEKFLPPVLWPEKLPHLRALYKMCAKTRSPLGETWRPVGKQLVAAALQGWAEGEEASEACLFGVELGKCGREELDLGQVFVEVSKERSEACLPPICEEAARWILEASSPRGAANAHQAFWKALGRMAETVPSKGEKALWKQWPWVATHWRGLLLEQVEQRAADFLLVGVVELLAGKQAVFKAKWWEPLDCAEYGAAVGSVLQQMVTGRIPAREAAPMLVRRVRALLARHGIAEPGGRAANWLKTQGWDLQKHKEFKRMPCRPRRFDDKVAQAELSVMARLLLAGEAHRQVLWNITEIAAMLKGPMVQEVLREAINGLDPKYEGMARCISRSYPYFNTALTKGEEQQGCPDVLTPLLELWLADDATRDEAVAEVMRRGDCRYFLFFGTAFARHLSMMRQEWLHHCLEQLRPCGEPGTEPEFYHYQRRGPNLQRVAQAGVKRHRIPCPRLRGCNKRSKRAKPKKEKVANGGEPLQLYLWHPRTQAKFLEKALMSTKPLTLAAIPRMEFADGIARVSELLESYPKDPSVEREGDGWGWEVLQTAGAYSSLEVEIERHFRELPPPHLKDGVGDVEVSQLLAGLGRADDAAAALVVLGRYAGKVKQAKEAVVKMVATLSPQQARKVMTEVMLTPVAGVSLQVAALRLIGELNIPSPLELYKVAWNRGVCHRDIVANLLSKLATTPAIHWAPDDVREFYDFFTLQHRAEDHSYVAEQFLEHLKENPAWTLPFLPHLVERLLMLPGCTTRAAACLLRTSTFVTDVVAALTRLLASRRLAVRARAVSSGASGPEVQVMSDLASIKSDFTCITQLPLDSCEPVVLWQFTVDELKACRESTDGTPALANLLRVWSQILRTGDLQHWQERLMQMETRLASGDNPADFGAFASCLVERVRELRSGMSKAARDAAIEVIRELFERLLEKRLAVSKEGEEEDVVCAASRKEKCKVSRDITMKHWPNLLVAGCPAAELDKLFHRCPAGGQRELATTLVNAAVGATAGSRKKGPAAQEDVARKTLWWLATPAALRSQHIATLLDLWAKVVAREEEAESFQECLELLGDPLSIHDAISAVDKLLEKRPAPALLREALRWLGKAAPEAAVARYPQLLALECGSVEDVRSLLALCESHGLQPPELPATAARALPEAAFQLFLHSGIPEARIVALQVLQAKQASPGQRMALQQLCEDKYEVVRVAARLLRASLGIEGAPSRPGSAFQSLAIGQKGGEAKGKGKGKPRPDEDEEDEEGFAFFSCLGECRR